MLYLRKIAIQQYLCKYEFIDHNDPVITDQFLIQNLKIINGSDSSRTGHKYEPWPVLNSGSEYMDLMTIDFNVFQTITSTNTDMSGYL